MKRDHCKKKKIRIRDMLPIIGIILGIVILGAYPALDIYYSIKHATAARQIQKAVSTLSSTDYSEYASQADMYNESLADKASTSQKGIWPYEKQLSITGEDAPFSELIIPTIALDMPVYHGTSDDALMKGVGHLEGTSLPVGGKNTNCVLSAHSGMSGMRAFDDIRKLEKGDIFLVKTLGQTLAYKVYDYEVLWPDEVPEKIGIRKGKDLCTLMTCTPYGVNDHRLLIYGERTEYTEEAAAQKPSVAKTVTDIHYWPFLLATSVLFILLIIRRLRKYRKNHGIKQ